MIGDVDEGECTAVDRTWIVRLWSHRYWSRCSDTERACSDIYDCENTSTESLCRDACSSYRRSIDTIMTEEEWTLAPWRS